MHVVQRYRCVQSCMPHGPVWPQDLAGVDAPLWWSCGTPAADLQCSFHHTKQYKHVGGLKALCVRKHLPGGCSSSYASPRLIQPEGHASIRTTTNSELRAAMHVFWGQAPLYCLLCMQPTRMSSNHDCTALGVDVYHTSVAMHFVLQHNAHFEVGESTHRQACWCRKRGRKAA